MASKGKRNNSGTLQNGLNPRHKKNRANPQEFRCPMCKRYNSEMYNPFWEVMGLAMDPYLRAFKDFAQKLADTGRSPVAVDMPSQTG